MKNLNQLVAVVACVIGLSPVYGQKNTINFEWQSLNGPYGGVVTDIKFHPQSSNILFIGTPTGLFKSVDEGLSWSRVVKTSQINSIYIGIDTIILAAGNKLYMSINGGDTWDIKSNESFGQAFLDPQTNTIIGFKIYSSEVLKSTDGGDNFETIQINENVETIQCMEVNKSNPSIVYVGTMNNGAYRSVDAGDTWEQMNTNLSTSDVRVIKVSESNPETIYLAGPWDMHKSTDGGDSWVNVSNSIGLVNPQLNDLAIHPTNPDIVYVGGHGVDSQYGLYKTENGGASWSHIVYYRAINVVAINPEEPNKIYTGSCYNGFEKSVDAGTVWNEYNEGLIGYRYLSMDESVDGDIFVSRSDWGGIYKTSNNGSTWSDISDFMYPRNYWSFGNGNLSCDPNDANILYASIGQGIFKSENAGSDWANIYLCETEDCVTGQIIAIPTVPTTVFSKSTSKVLRSIDGGTVWEEKGLNNENINVFEYDQTNSILYVGTEGNGIYKTEDNGENWINITNDLTGLYVSDIAVLNATLYVCSNTGISKSINGGNSWTLLDNNLPNVYKIIIDPVNPNILFVATNDAEQFYISTNSGDSWVGANNNLPENTRILFMHSSSNNKLCIATDNEGILEGTISQVIFAEFIITNISCNGYADGIIDIIASGGVPPLQYSTDNGETFQPSNEFTGLAAGIYHVVVKDANETTVSQIIVLTEPEGVNLGDDITSCEGQVVMLDAGIFDIYLWNNESPDQTLEVTTTGTYSVTVTDVNGCNSNDEIVVTFDPIPTANFTYETENLTATFTNTSENASSYLWDFGDGNTSEDVNPSHTYESANNYSVTLTATSNNCGDATDIQSVDIITSVENLEFGNYVKVTPNPSNGIISLEFSNRPAGNILVEVTALNGQIIYSKSYSSTREIQQIDLSKNAKGFYFVRVRASNFEKVGKLIIE